MKKSANASTPRSRGSRLLALGCWLWAATLVPPQVASAHGDLHLRIVAVTRQIEAATNKSAQLYLERGELQREHGDWSAAAADFARAAELEPDLAPVDLCRAKLLADSGRLGEALSMFDNAIGRLPREGEAFIGRARVLVKLGRPKPAIADYQRGLELLDSPASEYYVEWAQQLVAEGQVEEALGGLDQGIKKLGPVVKLQGYAVELELSRKNREAAVARLGTIIAGALRKESWLAKRGEIQLAAGKPVEARKSFEASLEAMKTLPPRLQQSPSMQALQSKVKAALAEMANALAAGKVD